MPSGTSQDNGKSERCNRFLLDKERNIEMTISNLSHAPTISYHGSACGLDFLMGLVFVGNLHCHMAGLGSRQAGQTRMG